MAVGDESIGYGATVEVNDGVADAFEEIGKIESITPPDYTVGTVASKRLDLTDRVVIHLPTLREGNQFVIRVQHTNAGLARFITIRDAYEEKQWRITIPDDDGDTEITVPGILQNAKVGEITPEGITVYELMVQVSGAQV